MQSFIRGLEKSSTVSDGSVHGVCDKSDSAERVDALPAFVEGLQQEFISLQTTVQIVLIDPSKSALVPAPPVLLWVFLHINERVTRRGDAEGVGVIVT